MGKGKKRGSAPFFQSAMFKVQSSKFKCGVAFATHIIHWIATVARLPRDDKRLSVLTHRSFMTWILGSASTHATRRAGPGPQDDRFLSFFIL